MTNHYLQFKNYLFLLILIFVTTINLAQVTVTYPPGNPQVITYRHPLGVYNGYERTQFIYEEGPSELNLPQSSIITNIAFYLTSINNPPGFDYDYKIYMREVPYSTVHSGSSTWASLTAASVLVFSGSMTTSAFATPGVWVSTNLVNNQVFNQGNGGNIEFLIETNWASSSSTGFDPNGWGNPNSIMFSQNEKIASVQWWEANNTPPSGHGTVKCIRPNIQVTYVQSPACISAPTGVTIVSNANPVCVQPFTLSLSGLPPQSGFTFQWYSSTTSSVAGYTPIPGATNATYQAIQTVTTWYYCDIGCGSPFGNPTWDYQVNQNSMPNCYCASAPTSTGGINIGNVTFATINNPAGGCTPTTSNPNAVNGYTDYTQTVSPPNILQGSTYPISMCEITNAGNFTNSYFNVFIDYNIDGVFDPVSERVFSKGNSLANPVVSGDVTIPYNTGLGITRMRVIFRDEGNGGGGPSNPPCGNYISGETEDYNLNLIAGPPCTNPVIAGVAVSSATNVCCAQFFTLSVDSNVTAGSGQQWQWESSVSGCGGPWIPIPGATASAYSTTQSTTTWYHCVLTCFAGNSASTSCVEVTLNPPTLCYCNTDLHGFDCSNSYLSNVTLNTLNDSTLCSSANGMAYSIFPVTGNTTTTIAQNATYNLSVTTSVSSQSISAWIDWDGNGVFDSLEWYGLTGNPPTVQAPGTYTIPITVPSSSIFGLTGMRIRSRINTLNGPLDACTNFGSGETEDYFISISTPIGINETNNNTLQIINLHPNPASSKVLVTYSTTENGNAMLSIMDITGKKIKEFNFTNNTNGNNSIFLDVAGLKEGFYLVRLSTKEASTVQHLEVIH